MSGMFGGGGDTQTVTQKFEPPGYTQEGAGSWQEYAKTIPGIMGWMWDNPDQLTYNQPNPFNAKGEFIGTPEQATAGLGKVAQLNSAQKYASDKLFKGLDNGLFGINLGSDGPTGIDSYIVNLLNGAGGDTRTWQNEYGPMANQYAGLQNASAGTENKYGGETNPAFEKMLQASRQSAEDSFGRTTGANLASAAAQQGAFGGSAFNEMQAANAGELNKNLNAQEQSQRAQQYNTAAGLEQQRLQNMFTGGESALGRQVGAEESRLGRAFQGNEADYQRQMQQFESNMQRQNQVLGMLPSISGMQTARTQAALGAGDVQRSYEQQVIDALMSSQQSGLAAHLMPFDIWGSMLSRASGQGGSSTLSQQSNTSPWQALLGAGLLGGGLYNTYK